LYLTRAKSFHYKLLIIIFHKIRNIHMAITMRLFFQFICNIPIFYTSRYSCLCAALLLPVCSRFGRLYFMLKYFNFTLYSVVLLRYVSQIYVSACSILNILSRVLSQNLVFRKYLPGPNFLSNMYIGFISYQSFIFKCLRIKWRVVFSLYWSSTTQYLKICHANNACD